MTNNSVQETADPLNSKQSEDLAENAPEEASKLSWQRLVPLIVLAIGLGTAYYMDLHHFLTFETLKQNRADILAWKTQNYMMSTFVYVIAYAIATAISIPGAIWMTIAGGFMFGTLKGGVLVVVGATIGASVVFLAARYAFADFFHAKCGAMIHKMEAGFKENAFSYLLVLRLVPLFPFWLVNLVPAFLGVTTRTFVTSTFIGIIPGTFVLASIGNGLGHIIDKGGMPNLSVIWSPEILFPLLGLALLALIPVVYRKIKK
jgi:uncharacterized membrane protein YdjX (TVP38/TMEM64 family)